MLPIFADMFRIATFQPQHPDCQNDPLQRREEVRRMRSDLPDLNAHLLRDIGLDPDDMAADERPPVWCWSGR